MSETTSVRVASWEDPPEFGRTSDDWPFPNSFTRFLIGGDLADKIRARVGEAADVFFTELTVSGGYSEYTQENDYYVTIDCGSFSREFNGDADLDYPYRSALPEIVRWLEEETN